MHHQREDLMSQVKVIRNKVIRKSDAVTKALNKKRIKEVWYVAGQWGPEAYSWPADEFEEFRKVCDRKRTTFLKKCSDPIELHLFYTLWNPDDGFEIQKIIKNPNCDAGTALRVYWEHEPYFYRRYGAIKDADPVHRENYRLIRSIETKFKKDEFASKDIPFDPTPWIRSDDSFEEEDDLEDGFGPKKKIRVIPKQMFEEIA